MLLQIYYPKYKAQRDIQLEQWKKLSDTFSKKTVELKFIENVDEKADSTNDPTDLNNVYASEQPKEMNYWVNIYSKLLLDVLSKCMVKGNFNLFATCSNSINDLIQNLASLDHQSEHINQLIYVQRSIVKEGLYNLKPHNIWMLNSSAFMWYLDSFGNKSFRTEYINDFNFQLFESIRFVINVKLEDVWKSFIGFSINSSYSHFSFLDIFEFVSHLEPVVYEPLEKEFNELFRKIENVDYHNYRETINSDFEAYFHKVAKNITGSEPQQNKDI
ncbi:MAG: hypothetical protein IPI23_00845 [Bacteroidetes bacterium]|nr:hypothetical protein [Bacteroidota bacterium]